MENRKDIGKAFREKLDGLQKSPGDNVWQSIRKDLPAKKKRFLLPFWLWATLIPLTIAITTGIFTYPLWENRVPHIYIVMPEEASHQNNSKTTIDTKTQDAVTNLDNTGVKKINDNSTPSDNSNDIQNNTQPAETGINNNRRSTDINTNSNYSVHKNNSVGRKPEKPFKNSLTAKDAEINTQPSTLTKNNKNSIAVSNKSEGNTPKTTNTNNSKTGVTGSQNNNNNTTIATQNSDDTSDNASKLLALAKQAKNDSIAKRADSIQLASAELAAKGAELEIKEGVTDQWNKKMFVYAFAVPTVYGADNASYIDPTLSGKSTTVEKPFSYGAYLGYNLTPNWSIRTGVINSKLQVKTENLFLVNVYTYNEPNPNQPDGSWETKNPIDYTGINYTDGVSNNSIRETLGTSYDQRGQLFGNINLIHKLEFLEVPVEATYTFYGDRFRIGVTGGVITRFITENKIYAEGLRGRQYMGKSKDDDVTFGAGLGAGFYYRLTPWLQLNAEPMMRYYFDSPANIKPLTFGVQAGLQYNFNLWKKKD